MANVRETALKQTVSLIKKSLNDSSQVFYTGSYF